MESLSPGYTTHTLGGTTRWSAVELFTYYDEDDPNSIRPQHTFKTDVWAFGMTVYVRAAATCSPA